MLVTASQTKPSQCQTLETKKLNISVNISKMDMKNCILDVDLEMQDKHKKAFKKKHDIQLISTLRDLSSQRYKDRKFLSR